MSSYPPPPPPQFPQFPPPPRPRAAGGDVALKLLIGSAVGMGVGFGLCGLASVLSRTSDKAAQVAATLTFFLFAVSLLGLVFSAIWLLIATIVGGSRR